MSLSQLLWPPAPVPGWAGALPWGVVTTARGPRSCTWLLSAVEVRLLFPSKGYGESLIGVLSSGSQCRASVWWIKICLRDSFGIVTFFFSAPIVSHILTVSLLMFLLSQALLTFWTVVITILNTSVESLGAFRLSDCSRPYASYRFLGLEVLCLLGKRAMRIAAEVLRHELEGWHSLPWWRYRLSLRTAVTGIWILVAYTEDDSKCAVVAPRVIFDEIDEDVDDTVFRRGLRTMSMLSIARSAVVFQHNFCTLFANILLLLVRFSLCVSSRRLVVNVVPRVS